jgi:hypothetical protein
VLEYTAFLAVCQQKVGEGLNHFQLLLSNQENRKGKNGERLGYLADAKV